MAKGSVKPYTNSAGEVVGYRARWRTPDGKSRQRDFPAQRDGRGRWRLRAAEDEAQAQVATVTSEMGSGSYVDSSRSRMLYRDWVADHWWTGRKARRLTTQARDETVVRLHLLPRFGAMPLADIDHLAIRAWVAGLSTQDKPLAPATIGKAHQLLAESLSVAVRAGYLRANPCTGVELPGVEQEEMRFLTPDEVARLAACMPERYAVLVLVLAYGGLRIGEAAALRAHRVDALRGTVRVVETLAEVKGHLITSAPKTKAGRRTVTLPRPVATAVADHLTTFPTTADGYVFTAPMGGPLRVPSWRRRVWLPATRAAGLEGLRIHDLRHTAVSLWIATGSNVLEVSRRAGHAKASFTLDRYGHLFPSADADLADRLSALYVAAPDTAPVVPLRAVDQ